MLSPGCHWPPSPAPDQVCAGPELRGDSWLEEWVCAGDSRTA